MESVMRHWLRGVLVGLAIVLMGTAAGSAPAPAPAPPKGKPRIGAWGFDLAGMDRSVNPGDDFFRYAVGTWVDKAEIPADLPDWSEFYALAEKADADVREVVERLARSPQAPGSVEQKVADAYASYLDTARINELGLTPFEADLALFRGLRTHEDVAVAIGRPGLPGDTPIAFFPTVDAKNPDRYTIVVTQSGLGLPSRDYYLRPDPAFAKVREEYARYIERVLTLASVEDAAAKAAAVADLEKSIAERHWPLEKARNKDLTYNPKTRADLEAFAPGFPWAAALRATGIASHDRFVVKEADAVAALAELFRATPVSTWRAYLTFHYLNGQADIMPSAFDEASFAFNGKVLGGQPQQLPRWRRAVGDINGPYAAGPLGDAVGRLYVKEHFPPEARAAVRKLVENLLAAYQRRIERLEWMSPETRRAAIRKAQTVRVKVGYPDRWKDYSGLTIVPGDAYGNRRRLSLFETNRQLARLDAPTDKDEWQQGPQTINAYYLATFNEIAFPAAILQPPFFDPNADPAVNYGGIGGGDRARDGPRLRRPGRQVRRERRPAHVVEARGRRALPGSDEGARGAVLGLLAAARAARQRGLHLGREHRRPRRPVGGPRGLQGLARREPGTGPRRVHGRAALLPGLGPALARQVPGRAAAGASDQRLPLADHVPGQRRRPEHGRLVRHLRGAAREQAVPRTG
jgi:predicted metalloendopeptidase